MSIDKNIVSAININLLNVRKENINENLSKQFFGFDTEDIW